MVFFFFFKSSTIVIVGVTVELLITPIKVYNDSFCVYNLYAIRKGINKNERQVFPSSIY